MMETVSSARGMVSAPHHLASEAGARVLEEGGNAIEAMIAAAASILVVYPHMNALGGDNFWLIHDANTLHGIDACGGAAQKATPDFYQDRGLTEIPARGPLAALTTAGAVGGWESALTLSREWGGKMPLSRLFEDAISHARDGFTVAQTLADNIAEKQPELANIPGFANQFTPSGKPPAAGESLRFPALADTLDQLARDGLSDFYRGAVAETIAADLEQAGSPLGLEDLNRFQAKHVDPLSLPHSSGTLHNMPPPTQGLASLIILGILDRIPTFAPDSVDYVHSIVEATKQAFAIRDKHITDPDFMTSGPEAFLTDQILDAMASHIDMSGARAWSQTHGVGDTVWLGAADNEGRVVSFIQSIYWEFGSGVVLPRTGIVWQNRGTSFSLAPDATNTLHPGRRPFHTIQPALAKLKDGRVMAYGSMGGDGQPQTQAAIFTRHVVHGLDLQESISAPRWLLGRTWGDSSANLRIENNFPQDVIEALIARGHEVETTEPLDSVMGHAGAIVYHPDGNIDGASDPRSDGKAVGL